MLDELLRVVLNNPDDMSARLVYADALQEAGDLRGEFIALHIEGDPKAEELLKRHRREWTEFLRPSVKQGFRFFNGFVERITIDASDLSQLPSYFEHTPLRQVRFRDLNRTVDQLVAMTQCTRRLVWLDLKHAHLSGKSFQALLGGRWDKLNRIWAPSNGVGNVGVKALAESNISTLRSINLYGARLNDQSLDLLGAWPQLPSIQELDLQGNLFSDEAMAAFCGVATGIRRLGLMYAGPLTRKVLLEGHTELELLAVTHWSNDAEKHEIGEAFRDMIEFNQPDRGPFYHPWP